MKMSDQCTSCGCESSKIHPDESECDKCIVAYGMKGYASTFQYFLITAAVGFLVIYIELLDQKYSLEVQIGVVLGAVISVTIFMFFVNCILARGIRKRMTQGRS